MLEELRKLIDELGFPSAVLVASGWFLKYIFDTLIKERQETERAHKEERMRLLNMLEKIMTHLISKK